MRLFSVDSKFYIDNIFCNVFIKLLRTYILIDPLVQIMLNQLYAPFGLDSRPVSGEVPI